MTPERARYEHLQDRARTADDVTDAELDEIDELEARYPELLKDEPLPTDDTPLLEAALNYAARGWRVVPLHNLEGRNCSCGRETCKPGGKEEKSIAKHPRLSHWQVDATTDETQIRAWWKEWPKANIGIATGGWYEDRPYSGVIGLDVDVHRDKPGFKSLSEIEASLGPLPTTATVITGSGGHHRYFADPIDIMIGNSARWGGLEGIDWRGNNGQLVAPPSVALAGQYRWQDIHAEVVPLPPKWLEQHRKWEASRDEKTTRVKKSSATAATPSTVTSEDLAKEDEHVLQNLRGAGNRDKFERLFAGDWKGYESQSEADLALCSIIAFWCDIDKEEPDPDRIDRLFRRSGLYRDKWDRDKYRERTLKLAVDREAKKRADDAAAKSKSSTTVEEIDALISKLSPDLGATEMQKAVSEITLALASHDSVTQELLLRKVKARTQLPIDSLREAVRDAEKNAGEEDGKRKKTRAETWLDEWLQKNEITYCARLHATAKRSAVVRTDLLLHEIYLSAADEGIDADGIDHAFPLWLEAQRELALEKLREQLKFIPDIPNDNQIEKWILAVTGAKDAVDVAVIGHFVWQVKRKLFGLPVTRHLMPIVVGKQGGGKSTAVRKLIAIVEDAGSLENVHDLRLLEDDRQIARFATKLICLADEMSQVRKTDIGMLKNFLSGDVAGWRIMRTTTNAVGANKATFIGTANPKVVELIRDPSGMRRFHELEAQALINWDAINTIDYGRLWAGVDHAAVSPIEAVLTELEKKQAAITAKNSVDEWLELRVDLKADTWVPAHTAFGFYAAWMNEQRRQPETETSFGSRIKAVVKEDGWKRSNGIKYKFKIVNAPVFPELEKPKNETARA